jgi:hypothetical protein
MADSEKPEDGLSAASSSIPHSPKEGGCGPPDDIPDIEGRAEDWPESEQLGWAESSAQEMVVYGATVRRIERMICAVGTVGALAVAWPLGWMLAVGVVFGTLLGWINFRWLAASVNAIGERIVKVKSQERGAVVVMRGVGRIFLIALSAYVIFTWSVRGLVGFLAGLATPVIALMCEAVYEFIASSRRLS